MPEETLAEYIYNVWCQLIMKNIQGKPFNDLPLQSIDYEYNIRGWLTQINNVNNLYDQKSSEFMDIFAFKINYDLPQFSDDGVKALYNGNISETFWRTANDNMLRGYGYTYDALNRLKLGSYRKPEAADKFPGNYNESLTYDKNGNINSLQRNGGFDYPVDNAQQIDDLSYTYQNQGLSNRLIKVTDDTGSSDGFDNGNSGTRDDYTYDANGNMITDANKDISIEYNFLNLPNMIIWANGSKISYL